MGLLYPLPRWRGKQRAHVGQRSHLRTLANGSLKVRRWTVAMRVNVMRDVRRGNVNSRFSRNKQHPAPATTSDLMTLVRGATTPAETTEPTAMHAPRCDKTPRLDQQLAKALEKLRRNIAARILMCRVEPANRKTARTGLCAHILTAGQIGVICHVREVA